MWGKLVQVGITTRGGFFYIFVQVKIKEKLNLLLVLFFLKSRVVYLSENRVATTILLVIFSFNGINFGVQVGPFLLKLKNMSLMDLM